MRLYYYPDNNFGDQLNTWLWQHFLPQPFNDESEIVLVGIGTLLHDTILTGKQTLVLGAGVGDGDRLPVIDHTWHIYCVRGPLSAQRLGLDASLGVIDPGILLHRTHPHRVQQIRHLPWAFMPHYIGALRFGKEFTNACDQLGVVYIDPHWNHERILDRIAQCQCLLTESLHGAIVAEAFRVPWIPVKTCRGISIFKWQDWCASIGLTYNPVILPFRPLAAFTDRESSEIYQQIFARELSGAMQHSRPCQISNDLLASKLSQLEAILDRFKQDWFQTA
jgi:succinoglycan biosynthesis protein ExoV